MPIRARSNSPNKTAYRGRQVGRQDDRLDDVEAAGDAQSGYDDQLSAASRRQET